MPDLMFKYESDNNMLFEENSMYYLDIPVLLDTEHYLNSNTLFLIDTGAYISVLNRRLSRRYGFDKLPNITDKFLLTGIGGTCKASIKEIPGLVIGGRIIKGVKVAIPHDETKFCILGLNVLEHFKFFMDTEKCKIFFAYNDDYKMPTVLKSAEILNISQ